MAIFNLTNVDILDEATLQDFMASNMNIRIDSMEIN
jgi:hypothetical protein